MCDSFDPYFNSISTGNSPRKSRASTNPPTFRNSISTAVPTSRPVLPSALPKESGHLLALANPSTLNPFVNSISTVPEKRRHYLASENPPTWPGAGPDLECFVDADTQLRLRRSFLSLSSTQ